MTCYHTNYYAPSNIPHLYANHLRCKTTFARAKVKLRFPSRTPRAGSSICKQCSYFASLFFFYFNSKEKKKKHPKDQNANNCHLNYGGIIIRARITRYWSFFRVIETAAMALRELRERRNDFNERPAPTEYDRRRCVRTPPAFFLAISLLQFL